LRFHPTRLKEVIRVEPKVHRDERGFFLEAYHRDKFHRGGIDVTFVQDNHSRSTGGTLRGLHAQLRHPQGKLVRATRGSIFDVAIDIRPSSPTFAEWVGVELSAENFIQLYVPPGFAHGFCALTDEVEIEYKCSEIYRSEDEIGIRWDDPRIGIDWPIRDPLLSPRDSALPGLEEWIDRLRANEPPAQY